MKNNLYFCGDWSQEASIDGALKSGRLLDLIIGEEVEKKNLLSTPTINTKRQGFNS